MKHKRLCAIKYKHTNFSPQKTNSGAGRSGSAGTRFSLLTHANVKSPITKFSFSEFRLNTLLIMLPIIISMKANWTKNCLLMFTEELSSSFKCEHECLDAVWCFLATHLLTLPAPTFIASSMTSLWWMWERAARLNCLSFCSFLSSEGFTECTLFLY